MATPEAPLFAALPDHVLLELVGFLWADDVARLGRASRRWAAVCHEEPAVWRGMFVRAYELVVGLPVPLPVRLCAARAPEPPAAPEGEEAAALAPRLHDDFGPPAPGGNFGPLQPMLVAHLLRMGFHRAEVEAIAQEMVAEQEEMSGSEGEEEDELSGLESGEELSGEDLSGESGEELEAEEAEEEAEEDDEDDEEEDDEEGEAGEDDEDDEEEEYDDAAEAFMEALYAAGADAQAQAQADQPPEPPALEEDDQEEQTQQLTEAQQWRALLFAVAAVPLRPVVGPQHQGRHRVDVGDGPGVVRFAGPRLGGDRIVACDRAMPGRPRAAVLQSDDGRGSVAGVTDAEYFEASLRPPPPTAPHAARQPCVSVGLVPPDLPPQALLRQQVGWRRNSVGVHSDDGNLYVGSGAGRAMDPPPGGFGAGDTIGCGVTRASRARRRIFFTRNGAPLPQPLEFLDDHGTLEFAPAVGLDSFEEVALNLEQQAGPFLYDWAGRHLFAPGAAAVAAAGGWDKAPVRELWRSRGAGFRSSASTADDELDSGSSGSDED